MRHQPARTWQCLGHSNQLCSISAQSIVYSVSQHRWDYERAEKDRSDWVGETNVIILVGKIIENKYPTGVYTRREPWARAASGDWRLQTGETGRGQDHGSQQTRALERGHQHVTEAQIRKRYKPLNVICTFVLLFSISLLFYSRQGPVMSFFLWQDIDQ